MDQDPSEPKSDAPAPVAGQANTLPAGFRLQEYTLESVLGTGGFGVTYLATDRNLNCSVALKEYLPVDLATRVDGVSIRARTGGHVDTFEWGRIRFLDEARALATFNHQHIVRVLRFFQANGTAYMVMEYIEGENLHDWVKRHRPVLERRLLTLARPLLDGLRVIHEAGFLHRDIKPGNIHVRPDGNPVLLDFGAAREVAGKGDQELTAIVTPGYAAFEQYHSHGNQGPWTDIYAFGAVLYGMVTGQRPVEAPARLRSDPLVKAVDAADRSRYSEALLRAIDWALEPDERKRPQTVGEFLGALPGSVTVGPITQRPAGGYGPSTPGPDSVLADLDPATLKGLEDALAAHLGPVASVLVRRTAKATPTLDALRTALSAEIGDERSRRVFLEKTGRLGREDSLRPSSRPASAPASQMAGSPTGKAGASQPWSQPSARAPTGPSMRAPVSAPGAPSGRPPSGHPSAPPSRPPTTGAPPVSGTPVQAGVFDDAFLAAVEAELAKHLGPLARVLVRKMAGRARDKAELFLLLADNIQDPAQRKAFVRRGVAAFREGN
jgi:serine/threonine protein kinase